MVLARDYPSALFGGTVRAGPCVGVGVGVGLLLIGGRVALGPGLGVGVELPGERREAGISPIIRHSS
jgi:hypothetical protein